MQQKWNSRYKRWQIRLAIWSQENCEAILNNSLWAWLSLKWYQILTARTWCDVKLYQRYINYKSNSSLSWLEINETFWWQQWNIFSSVQSLIFPNASRWWLYFSFYTVRCVSLFLEIFLNLRWFYPTWKQNNTRSYHMLHVPVLHRLCIAS